MNRDEELARNLEASTSGLPTADEAWRAMGRAIEQARPRGDDSRLLARLTSEMDRETRRVGSNRSRVSTWPYVMAASALVGVAIVSSILIHGQQPAPQVVVALDPLSPWEDSIDDEIKSVQALAIEPLFAMTVPEETDWLEDQVSLLSAEVESGEF